MKLYRNVGLEELVKILISGRVPMRVYAGGDSDCPRGVRVSFWFLEPVVLKYAEAIVVTEVDPAKVFLGKMKFSHIEDWPHAEIEKEYEIEEVYVPFEVKPSQICQIYVEEEVRFNLWELDEELCVEFGFNPWELNEGLIQKRIEKFPRFNSLFPKPPFQSLFDVAKIKKERVYKK